MPASKNRPTGPEPPPAVQQLLVRYAKRGRMRFASIRDVQRAFERAVRQAGLPIAHSAGFSPHPKISYASGTQTGVSSEAEYLTLALTAPVDSAGMRSVLDRALPDGIDVIEVVEDFGGSLVTPGLVDAHTHAAWVGSRHAEYGVRMAGGDYREDIFSYTPDPLLDVTSVNDAPVVTTPLPDASNVDGAAVTIATAASPSNPVTG